MECDQHYQDFINSINDPIMIIENGCHVSMVNDALLAMQEDTRENVIGKSCFRVLHHQDTPCQSPDGECPFLQVFETGRPVKVTHRHFTHQNKEIFVEVTASPLRNGNGTITRMLEVLRDVTAERLLQEEGRQSLEFLTSVLEGIGDGVVVLDHDYRILSANGGYCSQVGRERDEIIGEYCYAVSHHFDSHCKENGHDCPVRAVFEAGTPSRAMHTHYDHHGNNIFMECFAYPIKDASGNVVRAIETLNDVTERVQLEQKVKESEEKYRDLYDNAPDGYYSLNNEGLIVEVNRTFLAMLGYTREEIVAVKRFDELLTEESVQRCLTLFPACKKGSKIDNQELALHKKDGTLLPVAMSATAVFDRQGRFVMSRSVIRNISEKKKVDEEKKKLQDQLFQSQKLEALGTLAGGIAHDFNNLLASIMGYASLAKADLKPDHPVYRQVDIIESASLRASELTQQLLAFAKGGKYNVQPNDVNAIAREVVTLLSRTINKNISITLRTDDDLKPVACDAGQVQQAILNVCINARDAMAQGGMLTIELENVSFVKEDVKMFVDVRPGEFVRVSITDTGVGMDRETRAHIFDPFFTTKEKGTGLGLSLAYGIVRKHDGFIQVYSEPGKGSTFRLHLPAACVGDEQCRKTENVVELKKGTGTILVVDDETSVKDLARDILQKYGYSVMTAGDGMEAVALYSDRSDEIAAVLLDMVMPTMEGREVFQRLRRINPDVKVIVSSGYSHDRDADHLLKKGAVGFVQKPYRMKDLLEMVEKVLEKKGSEDEKV